MKRWLIGAGLLLALRAPVATSARGDGDRPAVAGSGKEEKGFAFSFAADGGPGAATGELAMETSFAGDVVGRVECLAVEGNRAALAGPVVESGNGRVDHFLLVVEDNGRNRRRPKDALIQVFAGIPFDCEDGLGRDDLLRIKRGDIRVD